MKYLLRLVLVAHLAMPMLVVAQESTPKVAEARQRAYAFLDCGITESQGINGLRRLGKVLKEDVLPQPNGGEIHTLYYEGMSVTVYLNGRNMLLNEVVISSPAWSVKYGLRVGVSKEQVEKILGKSTQKSQWEYADGMAAVVISFDAKQKVREIRWHFDID
ncbi:MAG: hypothetical protein PHU06_02315 [Gallionella sp.]|nr:hypothetical protein [Gallionella sp.]MDD4958740.1 hypothetical protein [Gallionella sp.]